MITLNKIRNLDLLDAASRERPAHLSAASGLVCAGSFIYVIADDELHLGVFRSTGGGAGSLLRLFAGELPASEVERKARKPDLEALTLLPAFPGYPDGALFALGSGSKPNRRLGALLGLDAHGAVRGSPSVVDLSPMFASLEEELPALNIEGALVNGGELRLLQRGNKRTAQNAVIRYRLSEVFDGLVSGFAHGKAVRPIAIQPFDLGEIDGIPLCFTDGAALMNGDMVFTAVAEDREDNYNDGPCAGAAVGIADKEGNLRCLVRLDPSHKVEGIDARVEGDSIRLLLVADADDATVPAGLFSAAIANPDPRSS